MILLNLFCGCDFTGLSSTKCVAWMVLILLNSRTGDGGGGGNERDKEEGEEGDGRVDEVDNVSIIDSTGESGEDNESEGIEDEVVDEEASPDNVLIIESSEEGWAVGLVVSATTRSFCNEANDLIKEMAGTLGVSTQRVGQVKKVGLWVL